MAFMSSPSTNEVHTAYGVSTASTQSSTVSIQVSNASSQTSTGNLSDATVYALLANQSNGPQLVHEDLEQIYKDDLEEMDLKWQVALLSMRETRFFQKTRKKITINGSDTAGFNKSKVECYNCHKMGYFIRECRGPRNQDSRNRYQDSSRRIIHVEETLPKAMVAIDGVDFDWSYMAKDEVPINMDLMAFLDSETDLSYSGLEEFKQPEFKSYGPKSCEIDSKNASEDIPNELKEYPDAPLVKDRVSDNKDCSVKSPVVVEKKTVEVEVVRQNNKKTQLGQQLDHLGKFDGKADEGYFVRYSMNSKAFRVYNIKTRRVEENLHIEFLENKPIVAGTNSNDFEDGSPLFDSSLNISDNARKKHDEVLDKESRALNELNFAFKNLNTKYPDDPKMPGLETIATYDDSEKEADFTNLESSIHDKYVIEVLRKFNFSDVKCASTLVDIEKTLFKDADGDDVDVHIYRSMFGSLMYLTISRPDIMYAVCVCARFLVTLKVSHLHAVKRIFRYLKGHPKLGLWYPRDSLFELVAYTNSDYVGASLDRKSTTGGCQFLGSRLISWQCKKQTVVATSTTKAEYVAATSCCGQFWQTATASTLNNREMEITATINKKVKVVPEAFVRRHLKLEDSDGISNFPITKFFEQLALMGNSIRHETKVPQSSSPPHTNVAEAASTGVDTPSIPHDSPLLKVHTLRSDEGRMQHNELIDLVTKLLNIVVALETDLKQTKKVYGAAYTKLIIKVKKLEKTIKTSQARRRAKIIVSDDEEDLKDPSKQGRKIDEIDQDPNISLIQHDAEIQGRYDQDMEFNLNFDAAKEVSTAEKEVSTAEPVSTAGAAVTTASVDVSPANPIRRVSTADDITMAETLVYIRRSTAKDKGKGIMTESEPVLTKTKLQQDKERLGYEAGMRLQEELDEEEDKGWTVFMKQLNLFLRKNGKTL
nr:uncharacterized mitochondrial protein AtMg00810-like [Tanacetum cinerariifolium]